MVVENKLGRTIHALRKKHKLTQMGLAKKVGVTYGTIGRWERGDYVPQKRHLLVLKGLFRLSDNEYDVLVMGLESGRPITSEQKEKARKQRLEASKMVGNDKLSEMEEDDPRLMFFRKAYGAL